jgi:hypothetical protein
VTRPGWLVRAEQDARDHHDRHDWQTPPDRDEPIRGGIPCCGDETCPWRAYEGRWGCNR